MSWAGPVSLLDISACLLITTNYTRIELSPKRPGNIFSRQIFALQRNLSSKSTSFNLNVSIEGTGYLCVKNNQTK